MVAVSKVSMLKPGDITEMPITTAEEKAHRRLEEDLDLNFLRILPFEWNTHVVVWRNKSDLDKISIDDLYNNLKIIKQEVKRNVGPSSSSGSQNITFISTLSTSNNDEVSNVFGVSTASPQVSTANLSDATVYAFLANQQNGSQLKTGKKITINGSDTAGYDKAKVKCFNCHKIGNFTREYRVPRNQKNKTRNQETRRRTVNVEDTSSKAMVAIDEVGFDWSYMANDEAPTNMPSMYFSDAEAINDESMLWNRRLGYINFKDINKHVKENLVRATKDETSRIPKSFTTKIENLVDKKNRVLVIKPHFKTLYELFRGRTPALSFIRPFGCYVTILNTLDHLGKFDGKSDEGFFVGYTTNSKAFRVYNTRTRKVEENLHINFLENKPIITGQSSMETGPSQDSILMPLWNDGSLFDSSSKDSDGDYKDNDGLCKESEIDNQERPNAENSTKDVNTARPSINTDSSNINTASPTVNTVIQSDDFFYADNDIRSLDGIEVDISNISTIYPVPTTLNTRITKDHSLDNVIGFLVYQMDVKSAFLYERIKEEVYVCQPSGFEDPDYLDKVYKMEKALYGLHQDPRAWYETLAKYLLDNGFHRGKIDKTFIKRQKDDILLVQVYVDDIIWLQVKQKSDGIFISQDKYLDEILKKFKYADVKPASTPMDNEKACSKIQMVMMSMFISTVKRIFRFLKGQPKLGFWYPRDSSFDLVAYTDSDYAGASLDRKSTSGGFQFLWCKLISW
uniref:Uncharacterized protein n=1 Tax=Tanacetum cinerariifolium TaxID=118510 RepID=A0A6L2KTI7_TANCI|nr:hypothetical protein [Tanacetum cinerariifolium]